MEDIIKYKNYQEFKEKFDRNIEQQASGFVEAGYLLKVARDTDILYESGYKSVAEFAKAEYGFNKDLVSRYIAINDRFSKNGYSEELSDGYKGYGYSKLAEMLTLPDEIINEISVEHTKAQIQDIKREIRQENEKSDIEVMLEPTETVYIECRNLFELTFYEWMKEHKEKYEDILKAAEQDDTEALIEALAPTGIEMLSARIPGKGKVIISIKGKDEDVTVMNLRDMSEKEIFNWSLILASIRYMYTGKKYADIYHEVAPVQQVIEHKEADIEEVKNDTSKEFYPEPVQMDSICYSCLYNSECERKSTITTECNEYINKSESEKTEEQKYNEEQDRIDKKTAKILKERENEEKLDHMPSKENLTKIHQIKIAYEYFDEVAAGIKTFELRKNDRNYKVGDELEMTEYKKGAYTGRTIRAVVIYMLEDYTGLEEDYCILGIKVTEVTNESEKDK